MKVLIFGANGRTGKHVVEQLSEHEVIAYEGDILDESKVEAAIKGVDAVISVIGHVKGSDDFVQTKGIRNVVNAMERNSVMRLISLTGTGVRMPGDKITLMDKILNLSIKMIDPKRIEDGIKHVEFLKSSRLDWTVVRVLKLTNGADKESWQLTLSGPAKTLIARASVASAIKQILEEGQYNQQAPIISPE